MRSDGASTLWRVVSSVSVLSMEVHDVRGYFFDCYTAFKFFWSVATSHLSECCVMIETVGDIGRLACMWTILHSIKYSLTQGREHYPNSAHLEYCAVLVRVSVIWRKRGNIDVRVRVLLDEPRRIVKLKIYII